MGKEIIRLDDPRIRRVDGRQVQPYREQPRRREPEVVEAVLVPDDTAHPTTERQAAHHPPQEIVVHHHNHTTHRVHTTEKAPGQLTPTQLHDLARLGMMIAGGLLAIIAGGLVLVGCSAAMFDHWDHCYYSYADHYCH